MYSLPNKEQARFCPENPNAYSIYMNTENGAGHLDQQRNNPQSK